MVLVDVPDTRHEDGVGGHSSERRSAARGCPDDVRETSGPPSRARSGLRGGPISVVASRTSRASVSGGNPGGSDSVAIEKPHSAPRTASTAARSSLRSRTRRRPCGERAPAPAPRPRSRWPRLSHAPDYECRTVAFPACGLHLEGVVPGAQALWKPDQGSWRCRTACEQELSVAADRPPERLGVRVDPEVDRAASRRGQRGPDDVGEADPNEDGPGLRRRVACAVDHLEGEEVLPRRLRAARNSPVPIEARAPGRRQTPD